MATHDYVIANASGAAVRADLNNALAAIVSNNSNATEPATRYAYQWWADTNAGILKFRNAANDAWIDIIQLDGEYTTIGLENGSAAAPSLFFKDSGTDTGLLSPGANSVAISTGGTRRLTVDSSGRLLVGGTASQAVMGLDSRVQQQGLTDITSAHSITRHSNDTGGARLNLAKSRATAVDGVTIVQDGDTVGQLNFIGADGTDLAPRVATIRGAVDGTPGANDMPGRLVFETTADGSSGPTERVQINSSGQVLINHSTAAAIRGLSPALAVNTPDSSASISIVRQGNDAGDARLLFGKNRNASPTGNTILVDGDPLGEIVFCGNDGTDMNSRGAEITVAADGTPGANDMPTSLTFAVAKSGDNIPTERFKIYQTGQPNYFTDSNYNIRSARNTSSESILQVKANASSVTDGVNKFVVKADGDCENINNRYGSLSDVKLKENIVDAGSQWDDLKAIKVKKYNYKAETSHGTHTQIGVIAQEIELICPGLVSENKDTETVEIPILDSEGNPVLDDEGNPRVKYKEQETGEVTKTVGYSVLYMKAVKALQEAMERIEQLETKVAALEGGAS